MGSFITLGLGKLELDWSKNTLSRNHSALFLPGDIKQAPYYYADGVTEQKPAYVRSLRSVVRRLEMLGYTMSDCEERYEEEVAAVPEYYPAPVLSYAEFARVLRSINVVAVDLPEEGDYDLGEYVAQAIMRDPELTNTDKRLASLTSEDGTFFENLDPYITLRLLAENPANLDQDVIWRLEDAIEGGWVTRTEVYKGVPEDELCLVVTEGSSDGAILRHSLPVVAPDIADFFDFVDMSENYPFTGTGNLYRFCQGLARIKIQNRILVVLDNDTAGREAHRRIMKLQLPARMHVAMLPDLNTCRNVSTLGPSGATREDINGKAVSIEWFLDLASGRSHEPVVRWTSYNAELDAYQGELLDKDSYTRSFLEAVKRGKDYDFAKLRYLWEHLVSACTRRGA